MTLHRAIGLLAVAISGAAVCVVLLASGSDGRSVVVELRNAAGLREDSSVRIAGATVGHVGKLSVTSDDRVEVEVRLNQGAGELGRDATAAVRSANLFGEKFLDIRAGSVARPLPSGGTIPLSRTTEPVENDQVLGALDDTTRTRLATLLNEGGRALAGRSSDFNELLRGLPPTLVQTGQLVGEFAADNRALGDLVERSDRIVRTIARQRAGLGRLVSTAHGALDGFAQRRARLGQAVDRSAPALVELRRALLRIERLSAPLAPAADALRASSPQLASTLRELPAFRTAARPALAAATRTAPDLVRLARTGTPVLRRLRPTTSELRDFSVALAPVTDVLRTSGADALGLLEGWARLTQVRDAAGHMFRNSFIFSQDTLESILPQSARRRAVRRGPKASAPKPATKPPRDREVVPLGLPKTKVPDAVSDVVDGVTKSADGVATTVDRLLDFLLEP